ncbi:heme-binding protein [Sphingomonas sp. 28-63-12]|uniref:heme-binding protein n=1 Tax=Sphingomonas sp. 28-63-12 TaxID=1970434 RepID=UPI000BDB907E|nr:MAG: hypothetical protein B7Y47_05815 [Sphingomonas sp. 28-63-12]
MRPRFTTTLVASSALILASCSGGSGTSSAVNAPTPSPSPSASPTPSSVYAVPAAESLSISDVQAILAGAIFEAKARNKPAVIAVTDRVGNVLTVFSMTGARATTFTDPAPNGINTDAQNLPVPSSVAAIAKAVTGAYLSSGGNAFSTRTASMIVQEHFPPAPTTAGLESGKLYGVQFSSLPCSDLNTRFGTGGSSALIGPKRSPLGLSADPGGFPLYKNGVLVGGIGVMSDGIYGSDTNILDLDNSDDEFIALAGTIGFDAPDTIRANRISLDGTFLRYSDAAPSAFVHTGATPDFVTLSSTGNFLAVRGYTSGPIIPGAVYGTEASGIRPAAAAEFSNRDAFVLSDGAGTDRFPIRGGTETGIPAITATEARTMLEQAFTIMSRARGSIRQPLDSRAQVSISLVDTNGAVLGVVRAPDAPVFGTDVSLQKARTAMFFSHARASADMLADPTDNVRAYVPRFRAFLNDPTALTGTVAYGVRAVGLLERPYFPDGEIGRPPGPLSPAIDQFNPFATGLQSSLILQNLAEHLLFVAGNTNDTARGCTRLPTTTPGLNRLANGLQIFPGGFPVYRGNQLIGGIGVSGDGIDQDDMIGFLGVANAAARLGGINHAPAAIRSDQVVVDLGDAKVRLRYVGCPFAPFLDTAAQDVCEGL